MTRKLNALFALLIVAAMILGACAPAAAPEAPAAVATEAPAAQAPAATEAPKPVEPTAAPTAIPEPTAAPLDFTTMFTDFSAAISAKGFNSVPAAKLNEELADKAPFLLDVREASEVEKDGYIKDAVNIPVREVFKNLDKLPGLDEPIVVYCASGHRGGMVMAALTMMGYTNVRNLGGGLGAWKKASLPTETGKPEAAKAISTPIVENEALYTAFDTFFSGMPEGFYTVAAAKLSEELTASPAPVLIDVRSKGEVDKDGYIEGSVHIPFDQFMASLDKLPAEKDANIVIYCASGHRGGIAMMFLRFLGYTNVRNLGGGLGAWKAAKMPVVGGLDWNAVLPEYLKNLQGLGTVGAADLNTELADKAPFLLDVREAAELEKDGYIKGAVNIPVREVFKNLDKLPALDAPIVVYCASGHRGGMVMTALQLLGYTNVRNLAGGLGAWKKAELPTETGAPEAPVAGEAAAVDAVKLAALDAWFSALPDGFFAVKPADLNTELASDKKPMVIDLRTAEEIEKGGMIEGATNIVINDLLADMSKLPADKAAPIVVVCQSGHRGGMALLILRLLGFTDVRNLGGGMNAWVAAELPVVK